MQITQTTMQKTVNKQTGKTVQGRAMDAAGKEKQDEEETIGYGGTDDGSGGNDSGVR